MRMFYRLDGHDVVPLPDFETWAVWFETADRTVATTVTEHATISTVFLGLDHGFGSGRPVLFETMVFGGVMSDHSARYHTWADAERGHRSVVAQVRAREMADTKIISGHWRLIKKPEGD